MPTCPRLLRLGRQTSLLSVYVPQPTCRRRRRRHHQGSDSESLFGEFTETCTYVQCVYVIGYAILLNFDVKSIIFITSYARRFAVAGFIL